MYWIEYSPGQKLKSPDTLRANRREIGGGKKKVGKSSQDG